ncbi:cold-shock protein [Streptomyces sp. NPDC087440]|uniref:cold-shock protein n=1 Tax=Streptomyces sp. NPDC087440 TaxID=3365790 RepID=UPI003800BE98
MATGTVKWFNAARGFGFIEQDGDGVDVFAHFANIAGEDPQPLAEGQKVTFDLVPSERGPMAEGITSL